MCCHSFVGFVGQSIFARFNVASSLQASEPLPDDFICMSIAVTVMFPTSRSPTTRPSETNSHTAPEPPPNRIPPPLPPRVGTIHLTPYSQTPPPYSLSDEDRQTTEQPWFSEDPRSSSTHSLVPSESAQVNKRTLLLIYIHGFLGNESSFQSFPAHVHNLLTITLSETHAVHTKIYPRYKSRKAIDFARDAFSDW